MHELTKIPLDVLHAIEDGYTVRMVSAYYFKGFIKMYAKFLGLDPQLVLDEPVPSMEQAEQPAAVKADDVRRTKFNDFLSRQNKKHSAFQLIVGGFFLFVLLLGIIIFKKHGAAPHSSSPAMTAQKEQGRKKFAAEKKVPEKLKVKAKAQDKPVTQAVVTKAAASTRGEEENEAGTEKISKRNTGKKVSLTIKARVTGWLQVKVDGEVVFQSTMREGTAESWRADSSIELSGKNINNLEFEVNGKVLGQLGRSERGARRVIVTSEGLSVKK